MRAQTGRAREGSLASLRLPDEAGYRRLLARYLGKAELVDGFTDGMIIDRIQGMSPADLEATITIHSVSPSTAHTMPSSPNE